MGGGKGKNKSGGAKKASRKGSGGGGSGGGGGDARGGGASGRLPGSSNPRGRLALRDVTRGTAASRDAFVAFVADRVGAEDAVPLVASLAAIRENVDRNAPPGHVRDAAARWLRAFEKISLDDDDDDDDASMTARGDEKARARGGQRDSPSSPRTPSPSREGVAGAVADDAARGPTPSARDDGDDDDDDDDASPSASDDFSDEESSSSSSDGGAAADDDDDDDLYDARARAEEDADARRLRIGDFVVLDRDHGCATAAATAATSAAGATATAATTAPPPALTLTARVSTREECADFLRRGLAEFDERDDDELERDVAATSGGGAGRSPTAAPYPSPPTASEASKAFFATTPRWNPVLFGAIARASYVEASQHRQNLCNFNLEWRRDHAKIAGLHQTAINAGAKFANLPNACVKWLRLDNAVRRLQLRVSGIRYEMTLLRDVHRRREMEIKHRFDREANGDGRDGGGGNANANANANAADGAGAGGKPRERGVGRIEGGKKLKARLHAALAALKEETAAIEQDIQNRHHALGDDNAEVRLLPIRPRSRGARRSLRTFPVDTLHPRFPFNV